MNETIIRYKENLRSTFHDFLTHELIAKDPYSLSEEEIWNGIKNRSNNRPEHQCDLINRMNRYCTLVTIKGHRIIPFNGNNPDYGVFAYTYNQDSEFCILYSVFKYAHLFSDKGLVCPSFGGSGKSFQLTVEGYRDGKRLKFFIEPSSLFEIPSNIGTPLFLEYEVNGENSFGSIKHIPSFVRIEGTESYFIGKVRYSLLKTKYFLLCLVDKYPTHLMHELWGSGQHHRQMTECFYSLYDNEMKSKISTLKEAVSKDISCHNVYFDFPF